MTTSLLFAQNLMEKLCSMKNHLSPVSKKWCLWYTIFLRAKILGKTEMFSVKQRFFFFFFFCWFQVAWIFAGGFQFIRETLHCKYCFLLVCTGFILFQEKQSLWDNLYFILTRTGWLCWSHGSNPRLVFLIFIIVIITVLALELKNKVQPAKKENLENLERKSS